MRPVLAFAALVGCANTITPTAAAPTDAGAPADAPLADAPVADVTLPPSDGGSPVTDDCARGRWCWERPLPSGERAADARVFSPNDAVYVTVGGTLARWDGARWRSTILSLPAPVRGLWAQRSDEVTLLCVTDRAPQRSWLVRVRGETPEVLGGPAEGFAGALTGRAPNDLWATNNRGLLHWNGSSLRAVAGPGDVLLSGLLLTGPDELIALENWGSGSGTGRLHRYDGEAWSLLTSFEGLGVRVEAPLVPLDGSIYLRAWDSRASQPEVVRYDLASGQTELITPPIDRGSVDVHSVGGALWATYASRAWRRDGARWTALPNLPTGFAPTLAASSAQDIWHFGDTVSRLREGGWQGFSTTLDGARGFWRDRDAAPALVTARPGGLAIRSADARGDWPVRPLLDGEAANAWAPGGGDTGWLASEMRAVRVVNRQPSGTVAWPEGARFSGLFGAWGDSLWTAGEAGVYRHRGGAWLGPVEVPRLPEAPRQTPTVRALHGVGPDVALLSTELVTGDKQVYVNVYAMRGADIAPVSALRGVFGNSAEVRVAGALPRVWIATQGLRLWDGERVRVVEAEVTPLDVQVFPDGHAVGTDGERAYVWTADGRRVGSVEIPRAVEVRWSYVQGDDDGTLRVAASGGEVLRYTP